MLQEIEFCMFILGIIIVAWCTDGGGDCKKMRRLLRLKMPELMTPHCWGHQVALLLTDYLKHERGYLNIVDQAVEVIKWFNNHSVALGLLRIEMLQVVGKMLALILPVLTRRTSHYISTSRLLEVQKLMRVCVYKWGKTLLECVGTEARAVAKAKEILGVVGRDEFWTKVKKVRTVLGTVMSG